MDLKYNFLQDTEPTDKQLEALMREVAIDVRKKREKADCAYQEQIAKEVSLAAKRFEALIKKAANG